MKVESLLMLLAIIASLVAFCLYIAALLMLQRVRKRRWIDASKKWLEASQRQDASSARSR